MSRALATILFVIVCTPVCYATTATIAIKLNPLTSTPVNGVNVLYSTPSGITSAAGNVGVTLSNPSLVGAAYYDATLHNLRVAVISSAPIPAGTMATVTFNVNSTVTASNFKMVNYSLINSSGSLQQSTANVTRTVTIQ